MFFLKHHDCFSNPAPMAPPPRRAAISTSPFVTSSTARQTPCPQVDALSSNAPLPRVCTPSSNIPAPFLPSSNGSASAESVRIAPVQASPASEMWHSMQLQQDLRKLVPQPQGRTRQVALFYSGVGGLVESGCGCQAADPPTFSQDCSVFLLLRHGAHSTVLPQAQV